MGNMLTRRDDIVNVVCWLLLSNVQCAYFSRLAGERKKKKSRLDFGTGKGSGVLCELDGHHEENV